MASPQRTLFRGSVVTLETARAYVELSSVGASVSRFIVDDFDHVVPSPTDAPNAAYRGAIIAPWPNRLGDGVYTFDGEDFHVPLTEHDRQTALHGLVSFQDFAVTSTGPSTVEFLHRMVPTPGYPFPLEIRVKYALADTTLTAQVTATNLGERDAPYGVCSHPYLVAGPDALDEWRLSVPAQSVLDVDDRLLPKDVCEVSAFSELDFTSPRSIGRTCIDHAYTGLTEGNVRVESRSGTAVSMQFDPAQLPWVQIHTADQPDSANSRLGLAVEPMTCPPDAFRTDVNLLRIKPGESHEAVWSITVHPAE